MGQQAHSLVWEESGISPGDLGGVRRPIQRNEKGSEAHPKIPEGSGGVGRPTRSSWTGRESHPEVREE